MFRIYFIGAYIAAFFVCSSAYANPVSFKGGYGVMPAYNKDWTDLQVNYSLSNREAVGVSGFYREGLNSSSTFGIGQYNYLLARWNELDSQTNVNLSLGGGGRHDSRHEDALAGYAAVEADYEIRRVYSQISAETLQSGAVVHYEKYRGRIGVAPYKAPFDSLNTWLVLQLDYMTEMHDPLRITPMARLFYNNVAFEVGVSLQGIPFVGGAAHF
jgi:hypothetical protein